MKFLRTLFGGLFTAGVVSATVPVPTPSPAEMMRKMRHEWLSHVPEKSTYKSGEEVVAVVMDWPLGNQTVTILASSSGDASLYTTATFGIVGGIGHEKVRKAAADFVACAQHYLNLMIPTKEFPYPDGQTLRFYVVTANGVRTVSFPMAETQNKNTPARILYVRGQNVLTELRQTVPEVK